MQEFIRNEPPPETKAHIATVTMQKLMQPNISLSPIFQMFSTSVMAMWPPLPKKVEWNARHCLAYHASVRHKVC